MFAPCPPCRRNSMIPTRMYVKPCMAIEQIQSA